MRKTARLANPLLLLVLGLLLSACAGQQGVMRPVAIGETQTRKVDMLVATTRQPVEDSGTLFSGERGEGLSLANVVISVPPSQARRPGTIQWPSGERPDPAQSFVTAKAQPIADSQIKGWFARNAGPRRRALIFVHGFNNDFASATFRFAQFTHDLGARAAPVLFTWPSRGHALQYAYDRESTIFSRFGLVTVLQEAINSPDVAEIFVVAHSMGSWLTMEAIREIGIRNGAVSRKLRSVVLASPDIDVDVFRRQVLEMGPQRPNFLIVASRNDSALSLSRWIAGDVDRLGSADLRDHTALLARYGIKVLDATDEAQDDPLGHNAFAESDAMLKAIATLLDPPLEGRGKLAAWSGVDPSSSYARARR